MPTRLSEADALKLIGSQSEALVQYLGQRGVAIAGFHGDTPSELGLGSGTCITIGGRFFIATAAHVIDGFSNDELFIIHTRTPNDVRTPILRRGACGGGETDPEDVAFLELAAEHAGTLHKEFVEASQIQPGVSELPVDNVLVYGYPGEKIDLALLTKNSLRVQPLGFLSPTMPLTSVRHSTVTLSADYDLIFEYPKTGNFLTTGEELDKLPAAPGISGGGVWATCLHVEGVWAPSKCRLIAIEHEWRKYKWARCTQIQHWLNLLATEIPELKTEVARILAA